jgi:hypothetical protein
MRKSRIYKYIKTLKPKRTQQQALAIYWFYLRSSPPEAIRLTLLGLIMKPVSAKNIKDYLWYKLIEKQGEDNVKMLVNTLADLADGKKRIRRKNDS